MDFSFDSKDGTSRKIIRLTLQEKLTPQISTALFLEYEAVIKRDKIQKLCTLSIEGQKELFNAFLSTCNWNEIFYLWRPNLDDQDDNFLIELAVASNSKVVITENVKDLTFGELHFDIEVLTPKQFLKKEKL